MVVGSEYVTLRADPLEGIREQILAVVQPILERYAAIVQPVVEEINRNLAATLLRDFKPPTVTLPPGFLDSIMLTVKINQRVFDAFMPGITANLRVFDNLGPALASNQAIIDATQALLRQGRPTSVAPSGRMARSASGAAPVRTAPAVPWSARAQATWVNMSLAEQLIIVYALLIVFRVVAHAAHAAVDLDLDYNPVAVLIASLESVLDNAAVTVGAVIVGRRLAK